MSSPSCEFAGPDQRTPHSLRHQLENAFGVAVCLKLASDGEWESALSQPLHPHRHAADDRTLDRWLSVAGDDVAAEVGFSTGAFVGLRLRPSERSHADELLRALLVGLSVAPAEDHSGLGVCGVLGVVDRAAHPRFAGQRPTRAEVGVLDRWQSLGAVDLGPPPWQGIFGTISRRPGGRTLTAGVPGPLMLEVIYGRHGDGWLAAPASRVEQGPGRPIRYFADRDRLDHVARMLSAVPQVMPNRPSAAPVVERTTCTRSPASKKPPWHR